MSDKEIMSFTDSEFQSKPYFKVTFLPVNLGGESFFKEKPRFSLRKPPS